MPLFEHFVLRLSVIADHRHAALPATMLED